MKYRKKPVVVEAFRFGMQEKSDLPIWAKEALRCERIKAFSQGGGTIRWAEIATLEGDSQSRSWRLYYPGSKRRDLPM